MNHPYNPIISFPEHIHLYNPSPDIHFYLYNPNHLTSEFLSFYYSPCCQNIIRYNREWRWPIFERRSSRDRERERESMGDGCLCISLSSLCRKDNLVIIVCVCVSWEDDG